MSIPLIPVFDVIIGPIVVPQGLSFLTTNSWIGTFAFSAIILRMAELIESVEYF